MLTPRLTSSLIIKVLLLIQVENTSKKINAIFFDFQADHIETDSFGTVEEIETYAENTVAFLNYTLLKCAGNIEL